MNSWNCSVQIILSYAVNLIMGCEEFDWFYGSC